ncbi:hypothetical protein ES703_116709 [subsurface metagenome]
MNKREVVLATLRHEEPDVIPGQVTFFSINGLRKFVPVFSEDWRENTLKRLEFLDNSFVEVGSAKLHQSKFLRETDELERVTFFRSASGSGVLRTKLIEETEEDLTFVFETGGRWKVIPDSGEKPIDLGTGKIALFLKVFNVLLYPLISFRIVWLRHFHPFQIIYILDGMVNVITPERVFMYLPPPPRLKLKSHILLCFLNQSCPKHSASAHRSKKRYSL